MINLNEVHALCMSEGIFHILHIMHIGGPARS